MKQILIFTLALALLSSPVAITQADGQEQRPNSESAQKGKGKKKGGKGGPRINKPKISDTVRANIYADNWFKLYINGNLVAVDSISFIPHNVVSVDILPEYPMAIAVMAKDNADPKTGLEYNNTNLGDGGFVLKFGDGTVTSAAWKAKNFFHGPEDRENPTVTHTPIPDGWFKPDFDDSKWDNATEHTEEAVSPKEPYYDYDFEGAKWIWTDDLALDNLVLFRFKVDSPPNGAALPPDWPRGHIDASNKATNE
ncbi:MAG: hypothetical protein AAF585_18405 [Verrucomicrobiota bacterium]